VVHGCALHTPGNGRHLVTFGLKAAIWWDEMNRHWEHFERAAEARREMHRDSGAVTLKARLFADNGAQCFDARNGCVLKFPETAHSSTAVHSDGLPLASLEVAWHD
jgi:hypothetical protein